MSTTAGRGGSLATKPRSGAASSAAAAAASSSSDATGAAAAAASTVDSLNPVKPAFDAAEYYIKRAPDAQYVSLQGFDLTDLVPLMGHLSRLHEMRTLNLAHNALWRLPENMSGLMNLESLDLTRNRFQSANLVLKGLYGLPNLRHLKIQLPEVEEEELVAQLSSLKTLNGIPLDGTDPDDVGSPTSKKQVTADGKKKVAFGASAVALARNDEEKRAAEAAVEAAERMGVDEATAEEMAHRARQDARDQSRHDRLESTRGYDIGSAADGPGGMLAAYKLEPWTSATSAEYRKLQMLCARCAGPAANQKEYDEFHAMVASHLRARLKSEPDTLRQQVHQYHAHTLMLEYSNEEVARSSAKLGPEAHAALRALADANAKAMQHASSIMAALQDDRDRKIAALQKDLRAELTLAEHTRVNPIRVDAAMNDFNAAMKDEAVMRRRKGQPMDLTTTKQIVRQILDSKIRHDRANSDAALPKETLEQHVYTFFTGRFDTKEAVRSAVASVLGSVSSLAPDDIDVAVFGRMLHQDLDEGYWTVHDTLKAAVYDTVFNVLSRDGSERGGHGAPDIISGVLNQEQVTRVLHDLFPQQDNSWRVRGIVTTMRRIAAARGDEDAANVLNGPLDVNGNPLNPGAAALAGANLTIGYRELAYTVLQQEFEQRLRDVAPVVMLFRELDRERMGVIDAVQMRMLIDRLAPGLSGTRESSVLNAVDPHGTNIIVFSDVVSVMARYHDAWWLADRFAASGTKGFVSLASSYGGGGRDRRQQRMAEVPSLYDEDVRGQHPGGGSFNRGGGDLQVNPAYGRSSPARDAANTLGRRRQSDAGN